MRRALRSAMPAIAGSSSTCIVGLLCLAVAGTDQIRGLGVIGALGITSALIAMLTLLPALLLVTGRRVFWPFVPVAGEAPAEPRGLWSAIGKRVARAPRRVGALTAMVLATLALGVFALDTQLALEDQFRDEPESITGQYIVSASFAGGATAPAIVVSNMAAEAAVAQTIERTSGVAAVQSRPLGDRVAFDVTLDAAPGSAAAFTTIEALRAALRGVPGAAAVVGGPDAETLDQQRGATQDLRLIVPLVLAAVLVLLVLLLRSLVMPVVLVGTVLLSFTAALGASVLLFEHVFGFGAVESSIPLLAFVFLVALGVDYNIFLMTRVQEEARRLPMREAVIGGLAATGGVITSAGLVLAATFSVLTVLPLVSMVQMGVIVAFGVLLDAIVVRSILVPAIALSAGDRIWWPLPMARIRSLAGRQTRREELRTEDAIAG
jgi:RND superfamily putative drug exporter